MDLFLKNLKAGDTDVERVVIEFEKYIYREVHAECCGICIERNLFYLVAFVRLRHYKRR